MMSSFDTSHSLNAYFLDYSFIYSLLAALHAFIPFGGIAVPTNVTLGNCLPSMLCVVDVYLTVGSPPLPSFKRIWRLFAKLDSPRK